MSSQSLDPESVHRTLPTTANELTGTKKLDFKWGFPLDYDRHRILEVSHLMLPGTSVQCNATGQMTTTEVRIELSKSWIGSWLLLS